MTDAEVMAIIRRRMSFVEQELTTDPPCTAEQWTAAMTAYAAEVVAAVTSALKPPPSVVDAPAVTGTGTVGGTLNCTMGNWEGEPTSYSYAWLRDGSPIGAADAASYEVVAADVDHSLSCMVTATNDKGSTAAPPSNAVEIAAASRAAPAREPAPARART